jgi:dihydrolipoamide dehydrogenase
MRTSVPGVYAAGDVTGFSMLAHTASREGEVAVNTILGIADQMHYNAVPGVVYTNPEVAGVGALEGARTVSLPMAFSGRFVAENERGEGLCKVVLDSDDCVIGVHMLGNPASELIHGAAIAIEQHMRVEQLERVIFPHPTVSEILKETVARA